MNCNRDDGLAKKLLVGVTLLAVMAGCGADANETTGGGGQGGEGASGGAGGSGTVTGSGGSGGDGGTSGELTCEPGTAKFEGSLDGASSSSEGRANEIAAFDEATVISWKRGEDVLSEASLGVLYLGGGATPNQPFSSRGTLRAHNGDGEPVLACTTEDAVGELGEGYARFSLPAIQVLGSCPGAQPVSGTIDICYGGATTECDNGAIVSSLEGATFSTKLLSELTFLAPGADVGTLTAIMPSAGLGHDARLEPNQPGIGTATVSSGYFIVPEGQPDEGAVYCIGADSTLVYSAEFQFIPIRGIYRNLTRLGSCRGLGTDSAELCSAFE